LRRVGRIARDAGAYVLGDGMSSANRSARPLSPHLQVYKPQLTSVLSITHRATGIALSVGIVYLVAWLCAASSSSETYAIFAWFNGSVVGRICLFGWTACLFYHLFNGIRHLFWDAGYGFDLDSVDASAKAVLIGAAVLSLVFWAIALTAGGGA
jgi:succinate dehydrogenase / fumarate reductase cytochrome b subunit